MIGLLYIPPCLCKESFNFQVAGQNDLDSPSFDDVPGLQCVTSTDTDLSIPYDTLLTCTHRNITICHHSSIIRYNYHKEEVCRDQYSKNCHISFTKEPREEIMENCYVPVVKECSEEDEND